MILGEALSSSPWPARVWGDCARGTVRHQGQVVCVVGRISDEITTSSTVGGCWGQDGWALLTQLISGWVTVGGTVMGPLDLPGESGSGEPHGQGRAGLTVGGDGPL